MVIRQLLQEIKADVENIDLDLDMMESTDFFMKKLPVEYRHNDLIFGLIGAWISDVCDRYWGISRNPANLVRHEQAVEDMFNIAEGNDQLLEFEKDQITPDMSKEDIENLFVECSPEELNIELLDDGEDVEF